MEVRKTNRVILDSDALKSPNGFNTNNSITSLILNEDHNNQIESELSFLEDDSELASLSPQPQPDLLIDLGELSTAGIPYLGNDAVDAIGTGGQGQEQEDLQGDIGEIAAAATLTPTNDDLIRESESVSSVSVESQLGVIVDQDDRIEEQEPAEVQDLGSDLAGVTITASETDDSIDALHIVGDEMKDPHPHEEGDDLTHTNHVKEQKTKETMIVEQSSSTSSVSSSTSSVVSSTVVMNTSSTTTKSSVKAASTATTAKEVTAVTATTVKGTTEQIKTATESVVSSNKVQNKTATQTATAIIDTNQINVNANENHVNGVIESTTVAATNANANAKPNTNGISNKKKNKNASKTSSESISVSLQHQQWQLQQHSWILNSNNPTNPSSTPRQWELTGAMAKGKIGGAPIVRNKKDDDHDVFSRVSVSFLRRSFDGDFDSLVGTEGTVVAEVDNECNDDDGDEEVEETQEEKMNQDDDNIGSIVDEEVEAQNTSEIDNTIEISESVPIPAADDTSSIIPPSRSTSVHRPKSCLGITNEVTKSSTGAGKRWNSGSSGSGDTAPIVFIPGDDFSGVSVNKLKSSFTKFDNLAKKELKSSGNNQEQEATTPVPNHICKACNTEVFQMELLRAEKADWHKNCFRCSMCNKSQTLDSYSSHEGKIYCKPHFRELFKPKTVTQTDEETLSEKMNKKVEVIIRESEPVPLPPDVVRASEKSGPDIQDLQLDVKSKYQLFESLTTGGGEDVNRTSEEISEELKKTGSVQARLAKYQSRVAASTMEQAPGVPDEELAGGGTRRRVKEDGEEEGESSGDEPMDPRLLRKLQPVDEINRDAIDQVRSKWELGINSKKEEISEARREEQSKFRTRLLMGKNTQMKDMYEKACEEPLEKELNLQDIEAMKAAENKAKELKELFEKGEPKTPQSESKLEKEVFESEITKNSRSLFKEMDKCMAAGTPVSISPVNRPGQIRRQESGSIRKQEFPPGEVVRSSDVSEEIISPEDISTKFKFFETFEEKLSEKKSKERFRMTPPRDIGENESAPAVEIYRDPNIIRSSDPPTESDIPVTRTASKMLSVFRQLEQEKNDAAEAKKNFKPLKEFTPPRETLKTTNGHDQESGDSQGEEESEDEEDGFDESGERIVPKPGDLEKDELLKQVGSLARATSLRLKFERWEKEENAKNKELGNGLDPNVGLAGDDEQDGSNSIESTKNLRAKFENYKEMEQEKVQNRRGEGLKVKRFVELTNNSGGNMENCVACEKRVYVMEKLEAGGKVYHKTCFRCSQCKSLLRMDSFTSNNGILFCKPHYTQLFKIKGNYDEGFGRETHRQAWEKKNRAQAAGVEEKEN